MCCGFLVRTIPSSGLGADDGLQRFVLAHHAGDESPFGVGIDKFDRIDSAERGCDVRRGHLAKEDQQLSVAERLASKRMLRSGLDQMRDIPVGQSN